MKKKPDRFLKETLQVCDQKVKKKTNFPDRQ